MIRSLLRYADEVMAEGRASVDLVDSDIGAGLELADVVETMIS
jgi:hypothetical protein